jgi:hypothetical protein
MDVRQVNDTDYADEDFPSYRVKFWSRPGRIPKVVPVPDVGFHVAEYEISDARSV